MIITVDAADREPPYQQIRRQVLEAIASGTITPETRLPTIRQLASDLGLASNTVARAYRELETDGAIVSRGRRGTFVRSSVNETTMNQHDRDRQLDVVMQGCVDQALQLGSSSGEIARALARVISAVPR